MTATTVFVLHGRLYFFNHYPPLSSEYHLKWLLDFIAIYGALCGVAGSALIPYYDLLNQMLVIIIGVASGGPHILQPNLLASLLFFTLTL
ncbi:TPA: GGDEF domain-containing protein, partial [Legionella pneumophila]